MKNFTIASAVFLTAATLSVPAVAATTIGTDENWTVGSVSTASGSAAAAALNPTTLVKTPTDTEIPESYVPNRVTSKWISDNLGDGNSFRAGQGGSNPGYYNFLGTVSLASISSIQNTVVRYWADNALVQVLVNGNSIFTNNPSGTATQFGQSQTFSSSDAVWQVGLNTIKLIIRNDGTGASGNPVAAMAEFDIPGSVPEPGTWMLMILGLGAVGFAMRRRQKSSVRLQFA